MLLNPVAGQGGDKPRSYYVLSNQNIIVAAPLVGALFVSEIMTSIGLAFSGCYVDLRDKAGTSPAATMISTVSVTLVVAHRIYQFNIFWK